MTLSDLVVGQRARLLKINGEVELRKKLVDMGMIPGSMIAIERFAPLGDPIDVKLRGYHLSLRKEEASLISVEAIEDAKR